MKVFISWSGDVSHKVALALRDWMPSVIQVVEPYVSSEDIDKGARWSSDISGELETSSFGIICITSQNIESPWINFEAGALSKSVEKSRVTPLLFRLKRSDIKSGPLLQFQSTLDTKDDIYKMMESINGSIDGAGLDPVRLSTIFEVWWPRLEEKLSKISSASEADQEKDPKNIKEQPKKINPEISEEIITLLRQQQLLLNDPTRLLPPAYLREILEFRKMDLHSPEEGFIHPAFMDFIESYAALVDYIEKAENPLQKEQLIGFIHSARPALMFMLDRVMAFSPSRNVSSSLVRNLRRKLRA